MTSGRRPYIWKIVPIRLGVTVVAVPILVLRMVIVVVSGLVAEPVGNLRGAGATTVTWWNILKWPVLLVVLSICWRSSTGPARTPSREVSSGSALEAGGIAVVIWVVTPPSSQLCRELLPLRQDVWLLAGVVIFLVWLWLSNIPILLGAEINAELEHEQLIADGLPEQVEPFVDPRDTRKLDDEQKQEVDRSRAAREP